MLDAEPFITEDKDIRIAVFPNGCTDKLFDRMTTC